MAKRAGKTKKLSISLDEEQVRILRRRAKVHDGNISAAVADAVRLLEEEEGRQALVRWLGSAGHATQAQRAAVLAEWYGPERRRRRRAAA
jgi:hypothetical protein